MLGRSPGDRADPTASPDWLDPDSLNLIAFVKSRSFRCKCAPVLSYT